MGDYVVDELKAGRLRFAVEDPDAEENWPRVLMMWRANLLGSSAKGDEYFLKHLLGTDHAVTADGDAGAPAAQGPSSGGTRHPRASSTSCSPWTSG